MASTHRGQGIGSKLLDAILEVARGLGASEAWVLTNRSNAAAMRLYASLGGRTVSNDDVMFTFKLS